jgi:cytochrome P450
MPAHAELDPADVGDGSAETTSSVHLPALEDQGYRMPPGLKYPLHAYLGKPWVKLGEPIRLFEHLHKTFGPISWYKFLGTPIVFCNHPAYVREVLINQAGSFVKERTLQRMKILLGEGLITSDDPVHMRQRRIAAPAFHRQRISAYGEEIAAIAAAESGRWQPGQIIDINNAMMELSLRIIARTLFDAEVTPDILSINTETNTIMGLYNFLVAMPMLEKYLHLPIPGVVKFRRSRARLDAIVNRMITERRQEMQQDPTRDRGDLLSMLIASRYETDDHSTGPDGMNDTQVRDEALTIFLAGYETVANALAWTWYLLSQNPGPEAELHAELDRVLGADPQKKDLSSRPEERRSEVEGPASVPASSAAQGTHRLPTLADMPSLRYTEQVFAEAMRLYPPAWAMGRLATKPVTLGPYRIPAGSHVFFSQYVMHRSAEFFPDPLRFDPSRHSPENKAGRDKFVYFPFGGGARQCIGESFAWMEGILAIATIASRWRMRYLDPAPPVPQARITLRPRDPMHMHLLHRFV